MAFLIASGTCLALAWAITEYIHNNERLRSKTLFATHYHELVSLAEELPKAQNLNVSINNTISIFEVVKAHKSPLLSESGIKNEKDAKYIFEKTGIKNFLIGESLLKSDKPEELMKRLTQINQ